MALLLVIPGVGHLFCSASTSEPVGLLEISKPEPVSVGMLKNVGELLRRRYRLVELRQGVGDLGSVGNLMSDLRSPEEISKGERKASSAWTGSL